MCWHLATMSRGVVLVTASIRSCREGAQLNNPRGRAGSGRGDVGRTRCGSAARCREDRERLARPAPELNAKQISQARKLLEDPTTIKGVAETFHVSRATIYRSLGLGKFAKIGAA